MSAFVVHRNGREATAAELAPLAFAGFAHMTAVQVRDGGVRGLDLHLERLRNASLTMFGQALPDDQVRSHLRAAVEGSPADHSLLVTVYSSAGEFTAADGTLDVLIRTSPAASGPTGPLSLATVEHERTLPELKHVGEVAKTFYLRQAVAQGFDDAAFLDRRGRFSEASIWNLAFWDGEAVVWPEADVLGGTAMGIVRRQLDVPQRTAEIRPADLPGLAGAVVMNSWTPGVAVHRIDGTTVPVAPDFLELLHRAYEAEPLVAP
ncbi:aminotransferase class IV family protein [Saccharopolyspora hirsuta]|uniref:Aminotransferase class IV family protein n=1 Tax=Saccharopolyspora hirsuta TaxID=1837 RepID=A0A5M7BWX6_SACHI|nr:aminotransferase class IV family protein [Saccharopolyspora hirsuta]KAA5833640.1 aminotransferase class IV family protein [Saccharopolyspora hirsuta]